MLRGTIDFLLHDWLGVDSLVSRQRFADHSRETFDSALDTCERIAREKYAPFNRLVDTEEPRFDGEKVILPQATHEAWKAYGESGMLSAAQDYDIGGMQLPYTVEAAANAFFARASVSIGSGLLTECCLVTRRPRSRALTIQMSVTEPGKQRLVSHCRDNDLPNHARGNRQEHQDLDNRQHGAPRAAGNLKPPCFLSFAFGFSAWPAIQSTRTADPQDCSVTAMRSPVSS